jgi:hypothetical protein
MVAVVPNNAGKSRLFKEVVARLTGHARSHDRTFAEGGRRLAVLAALATFADPIRGQDAAWATAFEQVCGGLAQLDRVFGKRCFSPG